MEAPHRTEPGPVAAVFDLDGVVTFTARTHHAAWKEIFDAYLRARAERSGEPFRPFEAADYRIHVDGRPRYEGVREFLSSRGIDLPDGDPSDPPDRETICGLGNRKQELFRRRLAEGEVDVDPAAVRLVRELRDSGIPVGMASSSKNAVSILERAGLADLFVARVDGVDSERMGLRGKPAPDIFLKCLELLGGGAPEAAMMVEDATAGVAAGRAGGFGLVLAVDRSDADPEARDRADPDVGEEWVALREHGADWIVRDFGEVTLEAIREYFRAGEHRRPNALARWGAIAEELEGRRLAVFLDYDGTLTPIVDRPDLAVLAGGMRASLRRIAEAWPTTIVSGRGREDVVSLVGVEELTYAASHGYDVAGREGLRLEVDPEVVPVLAEAFGELSARTAHVPGALVEDKRFSVAVHYRLVPEDRVPEVEDHVDAVLAGRPELRKAPGKKVFELRPAREWDKGRAVLWLLETLGLDHPGVVPVYVGDDATDEDAFRALAGRGLGVVVLDVPRPTAARYSLQNVHEVQVFLERLARIGDGRA